MRGRDAGGPDHGCAERLYGKSAASRFVATTTRARPNSRVICPTDLDLLEEIFVNLLDVKCILDPAADVVADH